MLDFAMLSAVFTVTDRLVDSFIAAVDLAQRKPPPLKTPPREVWNGTPEHLRGRPLPPVPDVLRW